MSHPLRNGAENLKFVLWTLTGEVALPLVESENYESLLFSAPLQEKIQQLVMGFFTAKDTLQKMRIPWRKGVFAFGPAGCGKSALSRAVAHLLGWKHVVIPAHEIHDTANLTRALQQAVGNGQAVVCIDHIDAIFQKIDPKHFFDIFDAISERTEGVFWVATSRVPENVPKGPLIRPGRFDESVRITPPDAAAKARYYENFIAPLFQGSPEFEALRSTHLDLLNQNTQLSFAHLEELRMKAAQVLMSGAIEKVGEELSQYLKELVVLADRDGGIAFTTQELLQKVQHIDPRLLLSALEVTDAFKRISEVVMSAIAEERQSKPIEK